MARLKVGVIGVGFGTAVQVPCFQEHPDTEVVAVCASRLARAQEAAQKFGVPNAFNDYRALVGLKDVDIVSVVTPPYLHHQMTMAALEAGKHVLCEKPFAMNVAQAREMTEAARRLGRVGMVTHEFRYIPARSYAAELVAQGYIGRLTSVNVSFLLGGPGNPAARPFGWQFQEEMGGGVLGALGSHYIDTVRFLTGDEVSGVSGRLETLVPQRQDPATGQMRQATADDAFSFAFRMRGGAIGAMTGSFALRFGPGSRIELYGTQGTLVLASAVLNTEAALLGASQGDEALRELPVPEKFTRYPHGDDVRDQPFLHLVDRLVAAVRGEAPPAPSFEDGLRCQTVLDAVRQSHRQGRWVDLPLP